MREIKSNGTESSNKKDRYDFPSAIVRVTAGEGGEALLVLGSEKTALIDCGMAYCANSLIENIRKVFHAESKEKNKERTLDYILATHSHYDHIGGMAAVKAAWPDAVICAGVYASNVLKRQGAIKMIQEMSNNAAMTYSGTAHVVIDYEKMQIEKVLNDGDEIVLGDMVLKCLETPGHTNCSLSFALEPLHLLFLSESTGVVVTDDYVVSCVLKSLTDTYASIEKCKAYQAKRLIVPHYGILPESFHERFWALLENNLSEKREFVQTRIDQLSEEEILNQFIPYFWEKQHAYAQPYEAFVENAKHEVKAVIAEICN